MQRRAFLAGVAALAATRAAAAPVLVADNYGLTPASAARRNGWIEVDAVAFETNIDTVRSLIGSASLCAVMKADAYGNGIALLIPSIIAKRIPDVAFTEPAPLAGGPFVTAPVEGTTEVREPRARRAGDLPPDQAFIAEP